MQPLTWAAFYVILCTIEYRTIEPSGQGEANGCKPASQFPTDGGGSLPRLPEPVTRYGGGSGADWQRRSQARADGIVRMKEG